MKKVKELIQLKPDVLDRFTLVVASIQEAQEVERDESGSIITDESGNAKRKVIGRRIMAGIVGDENEYSTPEVSNIAQQITIVHRGADAATYAGYKAGDSIVISSVDDVDFRCSVISGGKRPSAYISDVVIYGAVKKAPASKPTTRKDS